MRLSTGLGLAVFLTALLQTPSPAGIPDTPFVQEYHEPYPVEPKGPGDDVRAVVVDNAGRVWIATGAGVRRLQDGKWVHQENVTDGPTFDLHTDASGAVWVASWDGVYRIPGEIHETGDTAVKAKGVPGPIATIGLAPNGLLALGPDGGWLYRKGKWRPWNETVSHNVRAIATPLDLNDSTLWVATGMGLYGFNGESRRHYYKSEDIVSGIVNALAFDKDGRLWAGCWGGINAYESGVKTQQLTATEGLPHYDVRALAFAPDGTLWAGTALGVARYNTSPEFVAQNNGSPWSLRHSRRWLLSDDVRDVAIAPDGTAWIATGAGVSAIKRRTMTLAEKADHFMAILRKRHVRPPGLVEKCVFPDPNNQEVWRPRDDDNDGQYTSMYMSMESFRYAATKNPEAKANADAAFDALEFLQTVTGTEGFFARTVVPRNWTDMADKNEVIPPVEAAARRVHDPRSKQVEVRWRPSADGQWLWKGDTSSDEVTGHMSGYWLYYSLAADDADKERVSRLVSRIMDYIIDGGYTLRDIDGTHTRWGVWSPEKLKGDPDWRVEAPINAFEMLSFLKGAYRMTGNEKYQREYLKLIEKHGYDELARRPKAYGISERTHIDDELMALAAPALLQNEDDPARHNLYMDGYNWAYRTVENDQNPYFNFIFGLLGGQDFHLEESVAFLRDQPLDLVQWHVDNSRREDIQLVRRPMLEPLQTSRMLPPSERGVMRWDKNPWEAPFSGDFPDAEGRLESSGVFWLLPYWIARYAGYIEPPTPQD